jgi:FMN phosphatase YigB (HAD superfamily)
MQQKQSDRKIVLFDIDYTVFDMGVFRATDLKTYKVYDEVRQVLEKLKEIADLGIFSQGDVAFQKRKLVETNIEHYFSIEHIHIVADKVAEIKNILESYQGNRKLYFVDDRLPVLHLAKKRYPDITTIWVKRGYYAENQNSIPHFEPDATVSNLREIPPLIGNR